ncbi:response regulator [Mucilaginibacter terrenus]|uniref:Response regulator n=1 Tax=Mucilaginibacter terrenus TaxID=2482727 RepID=A0A3E2NY78_9SPHI|nr:response regulator [Mucilaginibacter terrenus]RFZ85810.1 response regulator [Mucilaginibacter terrenus]
MSDERKRMTACIIDDDEIFVYGFKKLMQIKGIHADTLDFSNGKEAIDYLKDPFNTHTLPDVIFVDINMPVMDGWEFTCNYEEIKARLGKKIPVYAISSSIDIDDIIRAKNNSVIKDYILKPIDEAYMKDIFNSIDPGFGFQQIG